LECAAWTDRRKKETRIFFMSQAANTRVPAFALQKWGFEKDGGGRRQGGTKKEGGRREKKCSSAARKKTLGKAERLNAARVDKRKIHRCHEESKKKSGTNLGAFGYAWWGQEEMRADGEGSAVVYVGGNQTNRILL